MYDFFKTDPSLIDYGRSLQAPAVPVQAPVVPPAATAANPGFIGRALSKLPGNEMMTKAGGYLMKDNQQLAKILAGLGQAASIYGGQYDASKPDTRMQQIARLVAGMGAGTELGKQPAKAPTPMPAPTPQAQPVNNDKNNNGVDDREEVTIKMSGPGSQTRVGGLLNGQPFSPQSISGALANPTSSTGEQAGTPAAEPTIPVAPDAPSVQNLNEGQAMSINGKPMGISQNSKRYQNLAMLGYDPVEIWKQDTVNQGAETARIEANVKAMQAPSEISKNIATAEKNLLDATDTRAKLELKGPYDPNYLGLVKQIEEEAKVTAAEYGKQLEISNFNETPFAKTPIPAAVRAAAGIAPQYKTYGDYVAASRDPNAVKTLADLYNKIRVADSRASGEYKGQIIGALNNMRMIQQTRLYTIERELSKITPMSKEIFSSNPERLKEILDKEVSLNAEKADTLSRMKEIDGYATQIGGFSKPKSVKGPKEFKSTADVQQALKRRQINYGDTVIVNGEEFTIKQKGN